MTSSTQRARRIPWAALVCAVAGVAVFQFFGNATRGYVRTSSMFWWWVSQWLEPTAEAEHGWLILALSGWLLWRKLRASRSLPASDGSWNRLQAGSYLPALAAMAAGLALHAVGFAAQQTRISIVAFLIFTWGVIAFAGGLPGGASAKPGRWGAAAAFPLAFLVFAIPFNALDSVGFWLRLWVIKASAGVAHAAGIGVLESGTQLLAPDGRYSYDVAAACSGIRSLTALAALSLLAGHLNFRSWWRQGAVLLLCFPLVYLGNVARVTSIVFAAHWAGQAWGERAHVAMGYVVFAIVLGGVLAGVAALRRWWPERGRQETGDRRQETGDGGPETKGGGPTAEANAAHADPAEGCHLLNDKTPDKTGREKSVCHLIDDKRAWGVAATVVALAAGEMAFLHRLATLPPRGLVGVALAPDGRDPAELPAFLGTEWIGRRTPVSDVEREVLPPDTGFSRRLYVAVADPAKQVFLSIVLSGRDRTSIHRPELCLVGQGWTIAGQAEHRFAFPSRPGAAPAGGTFAATLLRVRREMPAPTVAGKPRGPGLVPQLTAYWFVNGDSVVATHWQRFIHDAWNRVAHARADRWAYVLMQTDARDGEVAALARMQAVLNETLPAFQKVVPVQNP